MVVIGLFFFYYQFFNWMYQWLEKMIIWLMIEWFVDIVFLLLVIILLVSIVLFVNSGVSFFLFLKYVFSVLVEDSYEWIIIWVL